MRYKFEKITNGCSKLGKGFFLKRDFYCLVSSEYALFIVQLSVKYEEIYANIKRIIFSPFLSALATMAMQ